MLEEHQPSLASYNELLTDIDEFYQRFPEVNGRVDRMLKRYRKTVEAWRENQKLKGRLFHRHR